MHVVRPGDDQTRSPRATWHHLDIFQRAFFVTARVQRVHCQEHGVEQLPEDAAMKGASSS
jgi:hypothetical protein